MFDVRQTVPKASLYREEFEHDNCGIGACVNIKGHMSRETVENALKIVENLEHRAGKDAEGKTGDGVGILTQISHRFFKKVTIPLGILLGEEREYGVGMFFFPQDEFQRNQSKKLFEIIVEKEGLEFLGWREVPCNQAVLGHKALECMPFIMQAFVKSRFHLFEILRMPLCYILEKEKFFLFQIINAVLDFVRLEAQNVFIDYFINPAKVRCKFFPPVFQGERLKKSGDGCFFYRFKTGILHAFRN